MNKQGIKALMCVSIFVLVTSCSYFTAAALIPGVEAAAEAFIQEEEKILLPSIVVTSPEPTPVPASTNAP